MAFKLKVIISMNSPVILLECRLNFERFDRTIFIASTLTGTSLLRERILIDLNMVKGISVVVPSAFAVNLSMTWTQFEAYLPEFSSSREHFTVREVTMTKERFRSSMWEEGPGCYDSEYSGQLLLLPLYISNIAPTLSSIWMTTISSCIEDKICCGKYRKC